MTCIPCVQAGQTYDVCMFMQDHAARKTCMEPYAICSLQYAESCLAAPTLGASQASPALCAMARMARTCALSSRQHFCGLHLIQKRDALQVYQ